MLAAQLDEPAAPLERQRAPARVLVLRDRVHELRAQPARQPLLEQVDPQPVLVHRDRHGLGLCAPECHQRGEVGRRLDYDRVARIDQRLAHQRDALHPAARNDQLGRARDAGPAAAPGGRPGTRARSAIPSQGVYCSATAASSRSKPPGDLVELVGRERRRVREAARHRQHAGRAPGEDRRSARRRRQRASGARTRCAKSVAHRPGTPARSPRRGRARRRARRGWSGRAAPRREPAPRGSRARCARSPPRSRAPPRFAPAVAISRPSSSPKTMSPGRHLDTAARDRRPERGSRHRRARARRGAAREHRQPDLAQAAQVAAEAVGDDPGEPAPARLGREQLAEHGARPAVRRDHEHVTGRGLGERGHDRAGGRPRRAQ